MLRRLVAWGVVGSALSGAWLGCGDTKPPRRSPVAIAGQSGEAGEGGGACEPCGGRDVSSGGVALGGEGAASGAGTLGGAGAGGEPSGPGLALSALSLTQSVEVSLMKNGVATSAEQRAAPIVAGKRALGRAFLSLEPGYTRRPLIGVLDLKVGERVRSFVSDLTPSQSSLQDDLATTFTFDVTASALAVKTEYRLRVLEADTTPLLAFPETGYAPLLAQALEPFALVLVPMTINGYAPRVGQQELSQIEQRLLSLYPAASVRLSVAPAFVSARTVDGEGNGWEETLDDLLEYRADDDPEPHAFYYGLVAPAATYSAYCGKSCLLGLSNVPRADDEYERGAVGVAVFQDGTGKNLAWDTLAHELGHALGRTHADCGDPGLLDPYNPYEDGGLGPTYGYDFSTSRLIKPKQYRDVMSYCEPVWVSDYTYSGLFERLAAIQRQALRVLSLTPATPHRVARIDRFGVSRWRGQRSAPTSGDLASFALLSADGRQVGVARGRVARHDHLPGGSVWLLQSDLAAPAAHSVDLRPAGGHVLPL